MRTPLIIGGAAVALIAVSPHGVPKELAQATPPPPTGGGVPVPPGGWWWPVAMWRGIRPQISDGWGSPRDGGERTHEGADVGYWVRKDQFPEFRAGTAERSKGGAFIMPNGTPMRAMASGVIWSVTFTSRGIMVVIDHGLSAGVPMATLYQHMASCRFPARKGAKGGPRVEGGESFGTVGNGHNPGDAPANAYNHPHIQFQRSGVWVDPAPFLKTAQY